MTAKPASPTGVAVAAMVSSGDMISGKCRGHFRRSGPAELSGQAVNTLEDRDEIRLGIGRLHGGESFLHAEEFLHDRLFGFGHGEHITENNGVVQTEEFVRRVVGDPDSGLRLRVWFVRFAPISPACAMIVPKSRDHATA